MNHIYPDTKYQIPQDFETYKLKPHQLFSQGNLPKVINHIEKNDLIILDDFGLHPLDTNSRLALLQILEDFYERKSVRARLVL